MAGSDKAKSLSKAKLYFKKKIKGPKVSGRKVPVDVLIVDDHRDAWTIVTGICWTLIPHAETSQEAGALFASVIGAFAPELRNAMMKPLEEAGAKINVLCVPTEFEDAGYHIDIKDSHSFVEIVLFVGLSLMIPFKHISEENYDNFVKARVKGLGGSLGLNNERLKRVRYPLDLTRAKMVKKVFGRSIELKREILRYISWGSERTGHNRLYTMSRYVSRMLSWNKLTLIVSINEVLVLSESPVLQHASIQDEVEKYSNASDLIHRSSWPQYFRYFCTRAEEQMIQRRNFPTLGAVALEILNRMSNSGNRYIGNFAGTSKKGGALVQKLVEMHERYFNDQYDRLMSEKSGVTKFLFDDGDCGELLTC